MTLTKEQLAAAIDEYLEDRWRGLTKTVYTYTYDAQGNQTKNTITLRNDEALDENGVVLDKDHSDIGLLLNAIVSSVSQAIIEEIKDKGIAIGNSTADKLDVG